MRVRERRSTLEPVLRVSLLVMGVFTAVPVLAVVDPGQLGSAYGVLDPAPMELTLLQHRGVLQAVVGAGLIWAALRPDVRGPVAIGVAVAKTAALLLTITRPDAQVTASPAIQVFDGLCVVFLVGLAAAAARGATGRPDAPAPA